MNPEPAIGDTRQIKLRSIHVDGPQPGEIATVIGITLRYHENKQWLETYVARFDNGHLWFCPIMAIATYEKIWV